MESENIVAETAERIFADLADAQTINNDKEGRWKAPLWQALTEAGLPLAWVGEEFGGSGASLAEGFAVLSSAGRFAVAVPLALLYPQIRDGAVLVERLDWLPSLGIALIVQGVFLALFGCDIAAEDRSQQAVQLQVVKRRLGVGDDDVEHVARADEDHLELIGCRI